MTDEHPATAQLTRWHSPVDRRLTAGTAAWLGRALKAHPWPPLGRSGQAITPTVSGRKSGKTVLAVTLKRERMISLSTLR